MAENRLILDNSFLLCVEDIESSIKEEDLLNEYAYLKSHFCGRVLHLRKDNVETWELPVRTSQASIYVCGNIKLVHDKRKDITSSAKVIKELSYNVEGLVGLEYATLGEIPINLHNVAVYYRDCLSSNAGAKNYFDALQTKHKFQALTESNHPDKSFRKGIYLSEVAAAGDASEFHLLRCSTNLDGPTLAFVDEDREIVAKVNELAQQNFEQKTEFNHVLAQIYENSVTMDDTNRSKEHKAKIKSHSDKTKDMPANGGIAFVTFYSSDIKSYKTKPNDRFNRYFRNSSVLTQLRFKLKDDVQHLPLVKDFRVPLYPNSILLISLSTNRLYTHEIAPPTLPVGKFPTRLGYVVRCSNTKAVFRDGATFIQREGRPEVKLERPVQADIIELKRLYKEENATADEVEYKDIFFSMNEGDYRRPLVEEGIEDTVQKPAFIGPVR